MKRESLWQTPIMLLVVFLSLCLTSVRAVFAQTVSDTPLIATLHSYEDAVNTSDSLPDSNLSKAVLEIAEERQGFYERYFELGLHSDLTRIESQFDQSSLSFKENGEVDVIEVLQLTGKPILQVAKDHPVYKAAMLAIEQTKDKAIASKLQKYANEILAAVQQSIDEGEFTITFINSHKITYDPATGRLLSDEYSSESKDDAGTDKLLWTDGGAVRIEPDLTLIPDYQIYVTPITSMAKDLRDSYLRTVTSAASQSPNDVSINHSDSTAAVYIRSCVATTKLICGYAADGSPVYQDKTHWNSSYSQYNCNDCANYVSQALTYGGMATDSTWQPYTYAWYNVTGLVNYIIGNDLGYYTSSSLLALGDLGIIPNQHVVMASGLNPLRYSAHTNDRLNYAWQPSLTYCIDVY